ncbi:Der GTPase-activating protein YihI [Mannheimia pernigra]|uniref:Der GTPase-activating protein YihI n=1 Tax=Mannheimia pernigra TaxID=111844 RepID=A0A7H8UW44_9PAST|nr:Der GTPase-activating protein YihI [Mannheimia pernigra]QLB40954.1 Der GTPase-activating protein YihI [Mannheimia pernigra]QLB42892.1 Der GTPase-activating protein YihI [Mannheimia pernigra]QLB44956.1 Der GTPase-activating protein YihI [Mannheimia pernigra]
MSRTKKTRRITDIMPARKADKPAKPTPKLGGGKKLKLTRYELDVLAREEKRKRKHKGLPTGSRNVDSTEQKKAVVKEVKDPRIGSRKKVPLMVEFVNQPEKGRTIKPVPVEAVKPVLSPEQELEQLENNECLNQLLDDLEAGKTLSSEDQKFMNECLDRIDELMTELGIEFEDEESDNGDALLRQFETMDINKFR